MKKIKLFSLAMLTIPLFLFSCASTKQSAQDDYATQTEENVDKSKTLSTDKENKTALPVTKKRIEPKEKRPFISFGNKYDIEVLKETTCNSKNLFGVLGEKEAKIILYLKDSTIGIGTGYQGVYYYSLYDQNSRAKFVNAYNQYLSDFENKKLIRGKSNKTQRAYGTSKVNLRWGTIESSTPNNGTGTMYFGYVFEKNSPYFVITMQPVYNKHYDDVQESTTRESIYYRIYFTKAQAKDLADCFDPSYVDSVFSSYEPEKEDFIPVISGDEY